MLIYNIGQLLVLPDLYERAFLRIQDGRINEIGPMSDSPTIKDQDIDARGQVVMPGFVDCHTHLAHAGRMKGTFADRCNAVEAITEADLCNAIERRLAFMESLGTTTVEIKTGYATSQAAVQKCLAAIPSRPGVVRTEMSPLAEITKPSWLLHNNPRFVDALCDPEGLSVDQLRAALSSMKTPVKLHVCVSAHNNWVQLALDVKAVSVEHLLHASQRDIELLSRSNTIGVLLPAMAFLSKAGRFAPARALLDSGVTVAIATDANPGDSPTYSMPFVMQLSVSEMKMTAFETSCAATLNAAKAIHEDHRVGSLEHGKDADFLILASKDYRDLSPVERVFKSGRECLRTCAADALAPASFF